MITARGDECHCSEWAYTRPPPCTVVPQGTDVGQLVAAGVATGHTWYTVGLDRGHRHTCKTVRWLISM